MKKYALAAAAVSLVVPVGALAQETVVVTGSRIDRSDYDEYYEDDQSAIGLTRTADYFVKPIYVNSDSREASVRKQEVDAMLRALIGRAQAEGLSLVAGEYKLSPLTIATMDELLSYGRGNRPDTSRVKLYARLPVGGKFKGQDEVDEAITAFQKAVPVTGRSYIETGSTDLAIDNPDQYRGAVVRAIADESKRYAAMFGSDYGIEIRGLDSELYFKQASQTEVFLYIEHSFVIAPK
ncbi:hypothetical protein [Erythrobacter sp. THAF29]|uniref:hypothetical protein n=1 Tax=Erythrobacter sp. THAF29 TaxID=2587851 RepID=UPI00126974C7|nr:hypothetical protein [Erythrobacter sp. THAF29]QFT76061.1 hypothetical protein FIU90_00765 [Erythrobacter sp. THAF29]